MNEKKNAAPVYQTGNGTESNASLSSTTIIPQNPTDGKQDPGSQTGKDYSIRQLKEQPIWLCWRKKKTQDGRVTKVPVSPYGGATGTDEAHRSTWADYETARAAAGKNGWDGVGFVIPEGYAFLDLDGMPPEDPTTQTLMALLPSYAERSVSGNGTHIYMRCDLHSLPVTTDERGKRRLDSRYYTKNSKEEIELYIGGLTNRYAVFTGDAAADLPLTDCTEGLQTVLDSYMLKPKTVSAAVPALYAAAPTGEPDDTNGQDFEAHVVIESLRRQKNAEKFSDLFDRGDFEKYGYKSQSEADLALCNMIAFHTGDRPELIDAVFRQSALFREKWEKREAYRNATIRKAIASCREIFHPDAKQDPPFIVQEGRGGKRKLNSALLAVYIRENVPCLLVRNSGTQGKMLYVYENGVYTYHDKDLMEGVIKEPVERYNPAFADMNKIRSAYESLVTDRKFIRLDKLNTDESLINFQNGLLRVTEDSLTLLPHSPEIRSTIQIPCNWHEREIPTPVFDDFLKSISDDNPENARFLLQYMGVTISNVKGYRMKKGLLHVGPGNCGKSQLKSLVEKLLGPENCVSIDLRQLEARFGTGAIYGKRLAGSSDMSYMKVNEIKNFKSLTGGDTIMAEFKGQQLFSFVYEGTLWFCANELPMFGGDDGSWVYDRFTIIRSHNVIPPEKQDKKLLDKMLAEREGILQKLVHALQQVIRNGYRYDEPESALKERKAYMMENSSHIGFFESCMCRRPQNDFSDGITTTTVYESYRSWCGIYHDKYCKSEREFQRAIASYLHTEYSQITVHREDGNYYRDYTLTPEAAEAYLGIFAPRPKRKPAPPAA